MNEFFSLDGPFFTFIMKAGQVIIINIITLIFCIPIVTIVPSLSAMYYSMIKSVRRERGYVHKEFFRSFKHGFLKGILFSLIYGGLATVLVFNLYIVNEEKISFIAVYVILLVLMAMSFVYLIPVLSRFNMKLTDMIKLSVNMSIKHFPTTIALLLLVIGTLYLQYRVLPFVTVVFVPGLLCYASTYLIERVLKKYMSQENDTNEDAWYLE